MPKRCQNILDRLWTLILIRAILVCLFAILTLHIWFKVMPFQDSSSNAFNWNIAFLLATTFLCYAIVVPYMPDFEGGGEGVREPQMHPGNNQCSYVSNTYRCDLLITSCFSLLNVIVHSNCSFSSFLRVRTKKCRISVISRLHDTTLSLWDVPVVNNLIRKKLYIWICYIVTWTTTDPMSLSAAQWHHPASALPSIVQPSPFYGLLSASLVCSPYERIQKRKMPLQAQQEEKTKIIIIKFLKIAFYIQMSGCVLEEKRKALKKQILSWN